MYARTKLVVVALVCAACTSAPQASPEVRAEGPPRIDMGVVARHAEQFDEELAEREAGSQQEEAAAVYILAHLQRAGYTARLEAVPLADLVSSTDVVALPPDGGDPETLVAVPYDRRAGASEEGSSIGLFLELARALRVRRPRHSVAFAALGAERARVEGGHLGSRRLARLLLDEDQDPLIVTIERLDARAAGAFAAMGSEAGALESVARRLGVRVVEVTGSPGDASGRARVFRAAGLAHVAVGGGGRAVGRVLLEYLAPAAR